MQKPQKMARGDYSHECSDDDDNGMHVMMCS